MTVSWGTTPIARLTLCCVDALMSWPFIRIFIDTIGNGGRYEQAEKQAGQTRGAKFKLGIFIGKTTSRQVTWFVLVRHTSLLRYIERKKRTFICSYQRNFPYINSKSVTRNVFGLEKVKRGPFRISSWIIKMGIKKHGPDDMDIYELDTGTLNEEKVSHRQVDVEMNPYSKRGFFQPQRKSESTDVRSNSICVASLSKKPKDAKARIESISVHRRKWQI